MAKSIGMDMVAWADALDSGKYKPRIAEDLGKARGANLRVPTFIVNGRRAGGTIALVALLDAALKKGGRRVPTLASPAPDPARLRQYGATGAQMFLLEPRDDAWAARNEQQIGPMIERDLRALDPLIGGVRFECKAQQCRARWQPGGIGTGVIRAFLRRMYLGEFERGPESATPELYFSNGASAVGAREEMFTRLKSRRPGMLYSLRTGRTTIEGLPVDRVPKE
jgi:hypothetical protein